MAELRPPFTPTPPDVFNALQRIARHLRDRGYAQCVISPTGGASFELETVWDKLERWERNSRADERERIAAFVASCCRCIDAYKACNRIDPDCQACDLAAEIRLGAPVEGEVQGG